MKVFVTGATGFIGSALVPDLVARRHEVIGLARSDRTVARLAAMGAGAHHGDLDDADALAAGARAADGTIHLAFDHGRMAGGIEEVVAPTGAQSTRSPARSPGPAGRSWARRA